VNRILFLATGSVVTKQINTVVSSKRLQPISFPKDKVLSWFGGASQHNGYMCEVGAVIQINNLVEYRWTLSYISSTNYKEELMGAWASIVLAKSLGIQELHLMGDSVTVIN